MKGQRVIFPIKSPHPRLLRLREGQALPEGEGIPQHTLPNAKIRAEQ